MLDFFCVRSYQKSTSTLNINDTVLTPVLSSLNCLIQTNTHFQMNQWPWNCFADQDQCFICFYSMILEENTTGIPEFWYWKLPVYFNSFHILMMFEINLSSYMFGFMGKHHAFSLPLLKQWTLLKGSIHIYYYLWALQCEIQSSLYFNSPFPTLKIT